MHQEATCKRLVEAVNQEVVNVRRVKGDMKESAAMMKVVTQSHVAHIQSVQGGSLSPEESSQWIRAVEDRPNVANHQAKDKLEDMGALDEKQGPSSRGRCEAPSLR